MRILGKTDIFFFQCQASGNEFKKCWKYQWLGNSGWHIGSDKRSSLTVSVVMAVSGSSRVAFTRKEVGDERSHFYLHETQAFQKAFSKCFVLAILRKSYMKMCFQEWPQSSPLLTKSLTGYSEESGMFFSLPHSLHSVCTLVLRVKRKGMGVKGTRVVIWGKWSLQWLQFMCVDQKWLRKIMRVECFRWMWRQVKKDNHVELRWDKEGGSVTQWEWKKSQILIPVFIQVLF